MSKHPVSYTTFLQGIMYFILFRILYCFPILRMLFRTFHLYDNRLLHFRAYHYPLDTLPGLFTATFGEFHKKGRKRHGTILILK